MHKIMLRIPEHHVKYFPKKILVIFYYDYAQPHSANVFAMRLYLARKTKKISQRNLGIMAGMDEGSASARMNQYERGKHVPDFLMVTKIAQVLDLPTAYFYTEDDQLPEMVQQFHLLDLEQKQLVLTFIRQFDTSTVNP